MADVSSTPDNPLRIEFPRELPITAHVEEIRGHLARHPVVIVAGETGSGKTTQLPKICLTAGLGSRGMIGHTQPRRLAARTVAARIAEELHVPLGSQVGYAVRFTDRVSDETRIKLITDGLLLTEVRRDRNLDRYDAIIVDEAHERSLNVDFLLGYLKRLITRRRDLKIIITSATIDVAAFAAHFSDAPVVEVSGRTHPVDVRYAEEQAAEPDFEAQLLEALEDIETGPRRGARDVLVFLPGEREILDTARLLRREIGERIEILPLYARLSLAEQQKVFRPGKRRRVVLATNVAETSLTVPNIGYVIDPGTARISRYSFRSKLQRLPVEPISQASANQRAGRCGRIAPGVCYRLYSQADFASRPEYTDPEIKRTNLAAVVLQMRAFRLGDPLKFPFLDPPDPRAIRDADRLLEELGASVDAALTDTGRQMARLPVDPRLARMLVAAEQTQALTEVLIIVSALAVADPRDRPVEKQGSADRAHERWLDSRSDFLAYLNLWRWFEETRQSLTRSGLKRELEKLFLSPQRMREWRELHRQLLLAVKSLGMRLNPDEAQYSSIHRAVLTGSLSLIGHHDENGQYLGARNLRFRIFPGSALAQKTPRWLVAGEIAETRRVYARSVAQVEARWIEEAAPHLVKRRHSEPHWSLKRGEVLAYETVTLYGLVLADRRRVSYAGIDPAECRRLFLLEALVHGAVRKPAEFLQHNLEQAARIRALEEKGRRRDLLREESELAALYDERLPADITTIRRLESWLRKATTADIQRLHFSAAELSREPEVAYTEQDFPAAIQIRGSVFALKYRFAPGATDDGISIQVPLGALNVLVAEALEWSVPGMFGGVCEQWLRSLPKQKRRQLAPIADSVNELLPILSQPAVYRAGKLSAALARYLKAGFSLAVAADDWKPERIDRHWLLNIQLLDDGNRVIDQGRDLNVLRERHAEKVADRVSMQVHGQGDGELLRDFPEVLAETVTLGTGGATVVAYPALVDEGEHVALRYLASEAEQDFHNRRGLVRLAALKLPQLARQLHKDLSRDRELGLLFAPLGSSEQLHVELLGGAIWACFFENRPLPRDPGTFSERLQAHRGDLSGRFAGMQSTLREVLGLRLKLVRELDLATSPAYAETVEDIRAQVDALIPATVMTDTPAAYQPELPRYLEAARYRLAHLQGRVPRDLANTRVIRGFSERLERLARDHAAATAERLKLRFGLEEVRVGLFAEPLGVRGKASAKRLDRELELLEWEQGLI